MAISNTFTLLHWRREVSELFGEIRQFPLAEREQAWQLFRQRRDTLLKHHPQTPLTQAQVVTFSEINYYPYDASWRLLADFEQLPLEEQHTIEMHLGSDGIATVRTVGRLRFTAPGQASATTLNAYWIDGYGGGMFLPFRDATNNSETYGGGRYLLDTIKGADLGYEGDKVILDFNFAYNPSCSYNDHYVCPLSPPENTLPFAVCAGERTTVF
ncbi:MAG: DUF1684 domain-containing protein [Chloroflexota bacterium]